MTTTTKNAWAILKTDGKTLERFAVEGRIVEYGIYTSRPNLGGGLIAVPCTISYTLPKLSKSKHSRLKEAS